MSAWVGIGRSDVGLVRSSNQDAFLAVDHLGFWAIADGMGGHVGGDIAAYTAIANLKAQVEVSAQILQQGHPAPPELLRHYLVTTQHALDQRARLEPRLRGMGTTIVMLLIATAQVPTAYVAHVGDSRAYRYRSGLLTALTRDHTMIEQYLRHGILTEEAARRHPDRHVLTRALGMPGTVRPDISSHALMQSDLFLLCSDGLTKMLEDHEIAAVFAKGNGDPIRICDHLIDESLRRGSEDNVTAVVIAHP